MRRVSTHIVLVLVVGTLASVAAGRFMMPSYIPGERLIDNARAYIQEHPEDASGYYTLARIHYLVFANQSFLVGTFTAGTPDPREPIPYWWWEDFLGQARRDEAVRLALDEFGYESVSGVPAEQTLAFWNRVSALETQFEAEGWQPEAPNEEQLVEHAGLARWNFDKAISLDPNNALYYLGQASLGEQYLDYFDAASAAEIPPALSTILLDSIRSLYLRAYKLAIDEDLARDRLPVEGLRGIISHEAGSAYVRLWEGQDCIPELAKERIEAIQANLAVLEMLPPGPITPVVFSLEKHESLADLLAPDRIVPFDLDGDGTVERRSWVKPTTGLLVWDAGGKGEVRSGRQLFGSVTWWLLFPNGYRAMDVLDDDRDGWLTAGELDGISTWFDRNANGRSDEGEVVPVTRLGIVGIGVRPTGRDGEALMHETGIRLEDGRTVPSYDWIAPPAESAARKSSIEPPLPGRQ